MNEIIRITRARGGICCTPITAPVAMFSLRMPEVEVIMKVREVRKTEIEINSKIPNIILTFAPD